MQVSSSSSAFRFALRSQTEVVDTINRAANIDDVVQLQMNVRSGQMYRGTDRGDNEDDEQNLRRALAQFELANRSAERGSNLDAIAQLAIAGNTLALRELLRIVLEMKIAEYPVRSVLLDPADVDDAVQATLIVVATKIDLFRGSSSFKTWVGSIAKNEALQLIRRKQRKSEPGTEEVPDHDGTVRRLSSLVADEQIYAKSLSSLSEEHQEVLQLREESQLTYAEIAEQLGVPIGTVRSRINRARILLSELLLTADPDSSGPPPDSSESHG